MVDILNRITQQRLLHGWTEYQLAQKAGLPQSTVSSWYRKNLLPSLPSLEKICTAFDMTMAQFLAGDDNPMQEITPDQKTLLSKWEVLSPRQKKAFLELMDTITVQ